jgi:FKBP-type peptidyl-prolyl cis-trans isomerase FkpA
MKKYVYLALIGMLGLASCTESFKKGDNGIEYKIISNGNGKKLSYGNFMQLHIMEMYKSTKDTTLSDTRDFMPRILVFDSVSTPIAYFKILRQLKKGDSAVLRVLTDSLFKSMPDKMPPFMSKGKYLYTTVKLVNIFENVSQADSAQKAEIELAKPKMLKKQLESIDKNVAESKDQINMDSKLITDYLTKNNIKATKARWGTFVAIQNEGTGAPVTTNDVVSVNYTGRTLDSGKVFDSNTDPKFQHVQPYQVDITQMSGVVVGWLDGLLQLKKGSKATFYIPSSLGYGKDGNGMIKPNDNLIFDIEVVDVENKADYAKKMEAQQKAMQEEQQRKMDSMRNAQPAPKN